MLYTINPIPLYNVQQVNTQADADAWVASLTPAELHSDEPNITFEDVRVEVDDEAGKFWLRFKRTDPWDGVMQIALEAPLGGRVASVTNNPMGLNLWVEGDEENFNFRFQPYPVQP